MGAEKHAETHVATHERKHVLFPVLFNGTVGYMGHDGKIVVSTQYRNGGDPFRVLGTISARGFREGHAPVQGMICGTVAEMRNAEAWLAVRDRLRRASAPCR